jgi:hypothetical protein
MGELTSFAIGYSIGGLFCIVFTLLALKMGWFDKFMDWLEKK